MEDNSEHPKAAGIYKITCTNNGKVYIGKSVNIRKRLRDHQRTKGGYYFQNAILKYGWNSFNVEILEIVENFDKLKDNSKLLDKESYYIELYNSTDKDRGYNRCKFSTDKTGIPMPESVKEKLRQANLGRPLSDEHRYKIGTTWRGKKRPPFSKEHKENISKGQKGKILSDEHKKNIGKVNRGKKTSEETKEKMRQSHLGKVLSDEHKQKISKSKTGIPSNRKNWDHSEETIEKIRAANIGRKQSPETIEKRRQSLLGKKRKPFTEEHKENLRKSRLGKNNIEKHDT